MLITEQENTMSFFFFTNVTLFRIVITSILISSPWSFKLVFYTNECTYLLDIKSKLPI